MTITIEPAGHRHVADIEACLDFINSEHYTDGIAEEAIPTVDDAVAYFTLRGLAHEEALRAQANPEPDAWLARLYAARAALREVWDAEVEHRTPSQGALDALNQILREAPRIELVAGGDICGVGHRHTDDDPTGEALARVIQPFVDAIAANETDRFRICGDDGCREAFEDTSRGGRRRWCDMSSCGNRAKVRRFRSRHRADDH